ncbi:hypothetical protein B9T38_06780 [Acinetobacter sp. ANC 4218]|uniref:hypothetical protein n=1 Tax=Acinetobacter sp. ANC 4218 TaxID=1977880 RepID=UPI000A35007A|nr:hypothetical protein [Acinetobacter sp. ANC 4218]OTG72641.1 hypothetical protein B9T38_06780 [Acinetobacter sp. ANC 4218]
MEKNDLSSLPLIDEIYGAILTENNSKLDHIAERRSKEFENIRIIMSTPKDGGARLDLDLDIIKKKCPIIVSIFQHDNFFITSAEIAMQSYLTGGKSIVPIDWSFSYDSNFAEKLRNIFFGSNIRDEDKELIRNFIFLKKELSIQTDIFPMIIENVRLRRNCPENDRPRDTIASFKALDYIDWNKFEKDKNTPLKELTTKPWNEIVDEAEKDIQGYMTDSAIKSFEYKALFNNCILYKIAILYISNPEDASSNFSSLIEFCINVLNKLPNYELNLAWQFFYSKVKPPFWGAITNISKKIFEKIDQSMSWDLVHMRAFESLATNSNSCSIFIPFFMSFDKGLKELVLNNPITFMVINDKEQVVLAARKNEMDFQIALNEHMNDKLLLEMTDEKVMIRRNTTISYQMLEELKKNLTDELKIVIESVKNTA